ncbi:MAG: UbiD family decarboxylase [bacterium]
MKGFLSLREFLLFLEKQGEAIRILHPVDSRLEITEIASRALKEGKPALIFEDVRGADFPLAINVFASENRIRLCLGESPDELGERLVETISRLNPPSLKGMWQLRGLWRRLAAFRQAKRRYGVSQEVVEEPDLTRLPVLQCWPEDGSADPSAPANFSGRFFTFPLVITASPADGRYNVGIYRMQVFSKDSTGMHWQIQKGGGFHYHTAEKAEQPLEVAIAVGADPALCLAAAAPLPEGIDEMAFAGFLRGSPTPVVRGKTVGFWVPAGAEFVLEGVVLPKERRLEGPFGDHFGHYSPPAMFPVFQVKKVTRRRNPIYHASVVGKPPKEDKYLGEALQEILSPLLRLIHPELRSVWAYYEAGFHNLLVVAVEERYPKEAVKTALSLMGEGQLSLSKCIILVSPQVDPKDFRTVLREIRMNFNPACDFLLLPGVPLDTLDFTSRRMNLGSKIIIDATLGIGEQESQKRKESFWDEGKVLSLKAEFPEILDVHLWEETLLAIKVNQSIAHRPQNTEGNLQSAIRNPPSAIRHLLQRLMQHPISESQIRIAAAVSPDVDIRNQEELLWGIFTRFDGERDILFTQQSWKGISPLYQGLMGIDATWKPGYPQPLEMDSDVVKRVDDNWEKYWV